MNDNNNQELMLSIVVPVYNVEEYLTDCLDSIDRSIRNIDAEVILVDDGSTDASGEMAQEYADTHPGFRCLHKENGGLSDARNFGAAKSRGKYLAFVDSDDMVAENMYDNMIRTAEYHHAELTSVNVVRCNSRAVWSSSLHRKVFDDIETITTHINENASLIYDTTAWNKLILRTFWEENGFQYPVGWRFEDMPVSLAMHYKAKKTALVQEIGYYWRVRDGESVSITQENGSIVNLEHRLEMLRRMFAYIANEAEGNERLLRIFKYKVLSLDLILYINQVRKISKELGRQYLLEIKVFFDQFFQEEEIDSLPILMRQKYRYFFAGEFEKLNTVCVYGIKALKQAPVLVEDGQYHIRVSDDVFDITDRHLENDLKDMHPRTDVTYMNCGEDKLRLRGYLYFPRISINTARELDLSISLKEMVTGEEYSLPIGRFDNKALTMERGFVFSSRDDCATEYNYDGTGFGLEVDLKDISPKEGDYLIQLHYTHAVKKGSVFLNERSSANRSYSEGIVLPFGDTQARIRHDAYGYLHIVVTRGNVCPPPVVATHRPHLIAAHTVDSQLHLQLANVPEEDTELVYYDELRGGPQLLAVSQEIETPTQQIQEYIIDFSNKSIANNLYTGEHDLRLKGKFSCWEEAESVLTARTFREDLTVENLKVMLYCDERCILTLRTESLWDEDSNSDDRRRYHRRHTYRTYRELPLDEKTILFEAYWGAKYQCNPRYLYEYIDKHHPEYTCVWSLEDERTPITGNGLRVRKYSKEYYRYLATTKYLVNNVNFENAYVKRKGQIEIQTMHGTPYKSLGFDVTGDFPTEKHKIKYLKRNKRWNYLIVQGKFSEEMAWQWFRFDKTFLRTGYPRTDELFTVSEEKRRLLKEKFGLPLNKDIILYAPTFRQEGVYEMPLDLERMRKELSDRYVLLIRLHHFVAKSYQVPADNSFIFDFGGYNNIEDLFKVTDLLITDYSSIMFDFALTGKPMIFHTYDLDEYVNDLRGSYFDITKEAPGMITKTDEDLLSAIYALESGEIHNESRIERFRNKYLTYENNDSSRKVFQKVFVEGYIEKNVARNLRIKAVVKRILPKKLFDRLRELRNTQKI